MFSLEVFIGYHSSFVAPREQLNTNNRKWTTKPMPLSMGISWRAVSVHVQRIRAIKHSSRGMRLTIDRIDFDLIRFDSIWKRKWDEVEMRNAHKTRDAISIGLSWSKRSAFECVVQFQWSNRQNVVVKAQTSAYRISCSAHDRNRFHKSCQSIRLDFSHWNLFASGTRAHQSKR